MDVDRQVYQGGAEVARQRVSFCLDQLEKYGFPKGIDWNTLLAAKSLSMEEMVGALVAAEQTIKDLENMLAHDEETEGTTDDRVNFLNKLSEAGIEFVVELVDGCYNLTPAELFKYLVDADVFAAGRRGVTLEHWLAWKNYHENPRCYAITRKGKPCKILPQAPFHLEDFIPGVSEYCHVHQEHI